MSRAAYRQALACFLETAAKVQPEQWDAPALGVWSVRDLVGHVSRSITRVEEFGTQRAESVDITSAVHHYRRSLRQPSDDERVAQRGREAGQALGDEPLATMNADWARAEPVLDATDEDTIIAYDNGGIRFGDYLETRVFELTVHTLDLANAIGVEVEPSRTRRWASRSDCSPRSRSSPAGARRSPSPARAAAPSRRATPYWGSRAAHPSHGFKVSTPQS